MAAIYLESEATLPNFPVTIHQVMEFRNVDGKQVMQTVHIVQPHPLQVVRKIPQPIWRIVDPCVIFACRLTSVLKMPKQ